ncbi:multicopper oxidase domain-containing protein [Chroococcidiopsis sp. FACHB-1243]|uniref:multicopper oxidase domain-containing protein n=1 Tax=Chroococcidiopsis sp. [FACHB-1243] TaxID=2692781 RepID=UPI0017867B5B|nr:multicopper oxidase domain-containing protein [Chroococcidiopsis sp. [FACHB-1243]]MBD2309571.1 multicopper oxidase domain-containing protein [Chroococcidiopsis sp. [FACHB-1243]]
MKPHLTRRSLIGAGFLGAGSFFSKLLPTTASVQVQKVELPAYGTHSDTAVEHSVSKHGGSLTVGDVDYARNGFNPREMLTDWDAGKVSKLPDGRTLREYEIFVEERLIEIAPKVFYPAWTYNGRVPGPTLRVTEGDRLRIRFSNRGTHPHTIHFHGIHSARMDGVPGTLEAKAGQEVVYEFDAKPFGCHLYHCHSVPFKRHMHKGLYGAFIIDPDPKRHPEAEKVASSRLLGSSENAKWQEFLMVMNAFDTNFDEENEFYAINTIPHEFMKRPIRIERDRPVRVYLVNVIEFDPLNSFHLHANFFDFYDHGTTLTPTQRTIDTVMMVQAQRGILEFSFQDFDPGTYMFHAHQSEFLELGWMSAFEVVT